MITITTAQWIIIKIELHCYTGDWYLLRAKFRNDSNFLVREIGQERGVEERNSVVEVSWEVEEGDGDRNPVCKYFEKKRIVKVHLVSLLISFSWQQIRC